MSGLEAYLSGAPAPPTTDDLEAQYGIRPGLYSAIINRGEASGDNATSPKGANGRAQLMPQTAAALGVDPNNPVQNLDGGARYVAQLQAKYGANRPDLIAAAYNAGPGAVDRHGGVPPYKETQSYVTRVVGALPSASLADYLGGPPASPKVDDAADPSFFGARGAAPADAPSPANPSAPDATEAFFTGGKSTTQGDGSVFNPATGQGYNAEQTKAINAMRARGVIRQDAKGNAIGAPGTQGQPYVQTADGGKPTDPGAYYVDLGGNLQRVPLTQSQIHADADARESIGDAPDGIAALVAGDTGRHASAGFALFNGLMQGFAPEAVGGARALVTGAKNALGMGDGASMGDAYAAGRDVAREQLGTYAQAHPILSGVATSGGSLLSGAPLMELGGAGLMRAGVPAALGPTGEFLAGAAGRTAEGAAAPGASNALLRLGSGAANAAAQGAGFSAVASHLNPNTPLAQQMAEGAAGGVLLHGAGQLARGAGNLLMRVPGVGDAVRSFTEPLTAAGRDAITDRALRAFADGGPTSVNAAELVPGSQPTLATATGNRGLMAAEKAMRGTPEGANVLGARDLANDKARQAAVEALRGDNDSLQELIDARQAATAPLREAAFAGARPVDPAPVSAKIDEILASPEGKRDAVRKVLTNIKSKLEDGDGAPETDPAQLYGVRGAINDMFSGADKDDAKLAAKQLSSVKDTLDGVIETGAPGFRQYLKAFSDASGPVSEQKFLLGRSLTAGVADAPTLAKVKRTLDAIDAARRKPGVSDGKAVNDNTYQALQNLRDDLARGELTPDRNIRSDTLQNLGSNALLQKAGIPTAIASFHVPGLGFARQIGANIYESQNPKISNMLLQKLADPEYGAQAFAPRSVPAPVGGNALLRAVGALGGERVAERRRTAAGR